MNNTLPSSIGASVQPYKYGGKELEAMHGLNLYDFLARWHNPADGAFTSMDPFCEKYYHISPYAYCAGNPVKYVDPDGKEKKIYFSRVGLPEDITTNEILRKHAEKFVETNKDMIHIFAHGTRNSIRLSYNAQWNAKDVAEYVKNTKTYKKKL